MAGIVSPKRGEIVWINFDPVRGHEQGRRRPAVVISPSSFNKKSKLIIVCPLTSVMKAYPFEVLCEFEGKQGVILTDQIRTFDTRARQIKKSGEAVNQQVFKRVSHNLMWLCTDKAE